MLGADLRVPLRAKNLHHGLIGVGDAAGHHLEELRRTAGNQRHALLVLRHWLLPVPGLHIPEDHLGELVAVPGEELLCVSKIAHACIPGAAVELHVGDNEDLPGQLGLGHLVRNRCTQDQLKNPLQVGVGDLIEGGTVANLLCNVTALDLHQPGIFREGDEVVVESTGVPLGEVDAQRQCHLNGAGLAAAIHGAGAVNHHQGILITGEVFQRVPGDIHGAPLFPGQLCIGTIFLEARCNDLIGDQGAGVHGGFACFHLIQVVPVAFPVTAKECLAIFQHGLGGLLRIREGVILFPEVILQDPDPAAQPGESLAVLSVGHVQGAGNLPGHGHGLGVGGIDGGQPLGKQGGPLCRACQILLELAADQLQRILPAGSIQQGQQVVVAAVFADQVDILQEGLGLMPGKPAQDGSEYLPLPQTLPDVPGEEQDLHGQIRIFRIGHGEPLGDFLLRGMADGTDGGKQVQTVGLGACIGCCSVFGTGQIRFLFQKAKHNPPFFGAAK